MAVPGADIDYERIRRGGTRRQRLAQPLINGLTNHVLDYRTMHI
jgi:hypothetical protein